MVLLIALLIPAHNVQRVALDNPSRSLAKAANCLSINLLRSGELLADGMHLRVCLLVEARIGVLF
jgi:hypothetical protein